MYRQDSFYGQGILNSYLPTLRAQRYLNWFSAAGWHDCNALYRHTYPQGVDCVLVFFTMAGEGSLCLRETAFRLSAGSAAIIPMNTPMTYETGETGRWEFYWANLHGLRTEKIAERLEEDGKSVFQPASMTACLPYLRGLLSLKDTNKARLETTASRCIGELLDLVVNDLFFDVGQPTGETLSDRAAAYLEQHVGEAIRMEELAGRFYLSVNQFIRVFRAETGYTPYEYLKRYRLLKACELLRMTEIPVVEIGRRVGFPNASNFIYQFRRQMGQTPAMFRAQSGGR